MKKSLKLLFAAFVAMIIVVAASSETEAKADNSNYECELTITDSKQEWYVDGPFAMSMLKSNYATSGEGWSWDDSAKILTLDGFNGKQIIAKPNNKSGNITIVLKGENKIVKNSGDDWSSVVLLGRSSGGEITTTIKGDGTLTIDVSTGYMYCFGGDTVIFEDSPTLVCTVHDIEWGDGTAYSATTTILGKDATIKASCSDYATFTSSNEGWRDASTADQINGTLILENTGKYSAMRVFETGITKLGSDRAIYVGKNFKSLGLASGYANLNIDSDGSIWFKEYDDAYKNAKAIVVCGKNDDLKALVGYSASEGKASTDAVKIKKAVSTKAGQISVTWKKAAKASGYEIHVSSSENGKYKKAATVKKNAAKGTVKKQKSGSDVYVKVRAYTEKGGKKVYGEFSAAKKVRVK